MKRSCVSTIVLSVIGLGLLCLAVPQQANADFTFGEPVRVGSGLYSGDLVDCLSYDGLEMYFQSMRAEGQGDYDLYVLKRASTDDDWGPAENLGSGVNSPGWDGFASLSADGLTLYFSSSVGRSDRTENDIYMTTRATKNDPWGTAVNLGPTINSSSQDLDPWISPDGLELYFMSFRSGGYGRGDIWVTRRPTESDPWGAPVNLGPVVNSAYSDCYLSLSPDGLSLLFSEGDTDQPRLPGGYGGADMWMSRRASLSAPWQSPINLGPKVNGSGHDISPRISPDGRTLYFRCNGSNRQAPILPIVDFNGDGKVDVHDLRRLIESWDKDPASVDIGPMPWGDGKVDEKDLEVFMSYWGQEVNDSTLIAHWRLDETSGMTAADSAGTNDGTLMGNPTWQPNSGKVKGALKFDGGPRFVMTKFVRDPSAGPFSVFAWVKGGAAGQVVLSQGNGVNWLTAAAPNGALAGHGLISSAIITDGAWHRIGFVWDGSNRILYVDGVEAARDVVAGLAGSTGGLYIGAGMNLAPGTFWSGLIDDVRIYNRIVKP